MFSRGHSFSRNLDIIVAFIGVFNPFSAERRYIVAYAMAPYSSHCEKALSQNKFIKRYKGSNFIAKEFKKLFLCLTFCFYAGWCRDSVYT